MAKQDKKKPVVAALGTKLPNPWHRAERWSGGRVERDRTKYTRKDKHKNKEQD